MRKSVKITLTCMGIGLVGLGLARELSPLVRRGRSRAAPARNAGLDDAGPTAANLGEAGQPGRGRHAQSPSEIPPRGWKDILLRTFKEFNDDQIPLISAGMTFYSLLALFPGIGAFVALYGLFADVSEAQSHVQTMARVLPGGAISLIGDQMVRAAAARDGGLSLAFLVGLVIALWSANGAMKAIITGLNIAYDETEKRGFVAKTLVPLGFTVGFLISALAAVALAAGGAAVQAHWGAPAGRIYGAVFWPSLFAVFTLGVALLYRFGPSRRRARWRWISWGSALSSVAWLAMSAGFTFYVAHFGTYDRTYGALGAVIGFMTWTWLSSMVLLLGAELNAEIEHQTVTDTTVGPPKPLGARGAVMADTVGASQ